MSGKRHGARTPRSIYPITLERDYAARLKRRLRRAAKRVGREVKEVANVRGDSDATDARAAKRLLEKVKFEYESVYTVEADAKLAEEVAERAEGYAERQVGRQYKRVAGVDPLPTRKLKRLAMEFSRENVGHIKSIEEEFFGRLEGDIVIALRDGARWEQLADVIQDRYKVSGRKAELLARDQMGSLNAKVNQAKQQQVGVGKYRWRNSQDERVVGNPSGKYPEGNDAHGNHWEREGQVFSWSKPPHDGHPGEPINCLPGDSQLHAGLGVEVLYRRRYRGELTEIVTHTGKTFRATPNHPVLTPVGWKPIESIGKGDHVFECRFEGVDLPVSNIKHAQITLKKVFDAFSFMGIVRKSGTALQFHGDGTDEEVDIVNLKCCLPAGTDSFVREKFCKNLFAFANQTCPDSLLAGAGTLLEALRAMFHAPDGIVRGAGKILALFCGKGRHSESVRIALASGVDTYFQKSSPDYRAAYTELFGESIFTHATEIVGPESFAVQIISIMRRAVSGSIRANATLPELGAEIVGVAVEDLGDRFEHVPIIEKPLCVVEKRVSVFDGHVYNLQTEAGWYVADNIAVHNCRCTAEPVWEFDGEEFEEEESERVRARAQESSLPARETSVVEEVSRMLGEADYLKFTKDRDPPGRARQTIINGRTVLYEPDMPASGMSLFGEEGFVLGPEAYKSKEELRKTLLHEMHRLEFSDVSREGADKNLAASETRNAKEFADEAYRLAFKSEGVD